MIFLLFDIKKSEQIVRGKNYMYICKMTTITLKGLS